MYELKNQKLKVYLPKELDHHVADQIRQEVDGAIIQKGICAVVFDFQKTEFMDSSGIGLLMGRYKMVNYVGGYVQVVGLSKKLERLLEISNVDQYVQIIN